VIVIEARHFLLSFLWKSGMPASDAVAQLSFTALKKTEQHRRAARRYLTASEADDIQPLATRTARRLDLFGPSTQLNIGR
jgi:hypothetical protein